MSKFLLWLCCLLPIEALAITPLSPIDLLYRLNRASEQQNFQGRFIYQRGGDLVSYRIWHQVALPQGNGTAIERLLRLDGTVQEVIQQGRHVHCTSPNLQDGLPFSYPSEQKLSAQDLQLAYELWFSQPVESRVAGRSVIGVRLIPRDTHRYRMELSVDLESNILLKSELFNEQGQLLERMQFVDFSTEPPLADDLVASNDCQPLSATTENAASPADSAWQVQWLPPGFYWQPSQSGVEAPLIRMTYSDGFARFSVFLEPLQDGRGEEAQRQLGPTTVVSRRLLRPNGDWMVTVMGEIPSATAERIALSIRPPPDNR